MKKFARFFTGALMAVAALAFVSCEKDESGKGEDKEPTFAGRQWVSEPDVFAPDVQNVYIFDFDNQKKGYILAADEYSWKDTETGETITELGLMIENGIPMSAIQVLEVNNPAEPYKYRVDLNEYIFFKFYMVDKNTMKVALCRKNADGMEELYGVLDFTPATKEYDLLNLIFGE